MSTNIRAHVYQAHPSTKDANWRAYITRNGSYWFTAGSAPSWPEAMQLAYVGLASADKYLMEPVYASRAARREATA